MTNLRPFPSQDPFVRCVLEAAATQDRLEERRVAALRPYEFGARADLIRLDGYSPRAATAAMLDIRDRGRE